MSHSHSAEWPGRAQLGDDRLSDEARAFLAETKATRWPSSTASTSDIAAVRAMARAAAKPARDALADRLQVTTENRFPGVPAFEIRATDTRNDAIIFYIHGGAFIMGEAADTGSVLLADRLKRPVLSVEYRLAPEHPHPAALQDCLTAWRAAAGAGKPVIMIGMSAGATLVMTTLLAARDLDLPQPAAVVLLTPDSDLGMLGDSLDANDGRDPILTWEGQLDIALPAYIAGHDTHDPLLSPVYGAYDPGWPPTLIVSGTRDVLLSSCIRLERAMRAGGAPVRLSLHEGMWHAFTFVPSLPEGRASLDEIDGFIADVLARTS